MHSVPSPGYYFGQYARYGKVTMTTQGGQTARPYQEVSPCNGGTFAGSVEGELSKGGAENVLFYYPLYIQPGGLIGIVRARHASPLQDTKKNEINFIFFRIFAFTLKKNEYAIHKKPPR